MSVRVGSAHIQVVPSFKGFQQASKKEMQNSMPAVGRSAADSFAASAARAMADGGKAAGRAVTTAISSAMRGAGARVVAAGKSVADAAVGGVNGSFATGRLQGMYFVDRVQEGITSRRDNLVKRAKSLGESVTTKISEGVKAYGPRVTQAVDAILTQAATNKWVIGAKLSQEWLGGVITSIRTGAGRVAGAVQSLFGPVVGPVVGKALSVGRSFITSVGGTIRAGVGAVTGAVTGLFSGTAGVARTAGATAGSGFVSSMKAMLGPMAAMFSAAAIFGGGFNRLANIDDAQKRMEGLGKSAEEIESVMSSASSAVTDTAYGLDAAASAATGALGAGVGLGEEMTGYLSLIGDMTTQSKTDFGSMSNIMNKIRGDGKLTGETLAQLTDNGLYAAPMLADAFGVTQAELREMVSKGEVSAEDFERIMTDTIGGSALRSGETVRGALANVRAALSRTGAALMGGEGGFSLIPGVLTQIKDAVNGLNGKIAEGWEWIRANKEWLGPMVSGALAAVGAFKGLQVASGMLNGALRLLAANPLVLTIMAIGAAVGYLWSTNEGFRAFVVEAWAAIQDVISSAWETHIEPALTAIVAFVTESLVPAIMSFWQDTIVPAWTTISQVISQAWESTIRPALERLWEFIANVLAPVVVSLWQNVIVPAWGAISAIITSAWNNVIKPVFTALWNFINDTLAPVFFFLWDNVIRPVFGWIGDRVSAIWENVVKPIFQAMKSFAEGDLVAGFQSLWDAVKNIFGWIGNTIASAFAAPVNWILDVVWNNGIAGTFNGVMEALRLDWRLGLATLIGPPPAASTAGPGRGSSGGMTAVSAYAEGGFANRGWALVGEEGPELVNFTNPGRVYTAAETAAALAAGEDLSPSLARAAAGRTPAEALAPMGGNIFTDLWDAGVSWVRGRLADGAGVVLNPLKDLITSTIGQLGFPGALIGGSASKTIDGFLDWIRGQEAEQAEAEGVGGMLAAPIGSAPGSWVRPSRGGITSRFGPRWGGIHAGIDIGGGGPTYAAAAGTVLNTGWNIGPGRTGIGILLGHGGNMFTYYGHNPVGGVRVAKGQEVARGQHIGAQGATGRVTGVHLHFELHKGGPWRAVNPTSLGVFDDGGYLPPGGLAMNLSRKPEPVFSAAQWDKIAALTAAGHVGTLPDHVALLDESGALLGRMRVVAGDVVRERDVAVARRARAGVRS